MRLPSHLGERLGAAVAGAVREAARLHAEHTSIEHLFCVVMADEECAAVAAVEHAFADARTLRDEALAIAPGQLVVGSRSTLPFSPAAALAIERARVPDAAQLEPAHLLRSAVAHLAPEQRERLSAAGALLAAIPPAPAGAVSVPAHAAFAALSKAAKEALARANHAAAGLEVTAIGPVHLLLGCLQEGSVAALAGELGLRATLVRAALAGSSADPSPVPDREPPLEEGLAELIATLPPGAGTLAFLTAVHRDPRVPSELRQILERHKVSPALLERAAAAFADPGS